MDAIHDRSDCWLVAAGNRVHVLPLALRRRFDIELEVTSPTLPDRIELVTRACQAFSQLGCIDAGTIEKVAEAAHGYTGSDLMSVCRLANTQLIFDTCEDDDDKESAMSRNTKPESVGRVLVQSLRAVRPSAMREISLEVPHVKWTDIGGYEDVKLVVQQAVEWPHQHAAAFKRLKVQPPVGILLYGPPGCSKTLIARATATESKLNFLAVKGPELFSKWVGESERAIRDLFKRARQAAPAIIFFDEIDALAQSRSSDKQASAVGDRILTQLLTELDGLESLAGVTILAATNRPDVIDSALLRPGRLDRLIYVPLPDATSRRSIVQLNMTRFDPAPDDIDIEQFVEDTDGYSGAEIACVMREACMSAMREDINIGRIHQRHVDHALTLVSPITPPHLIQYFEEFANGTSRKL